MDPAASRIAILSGIVAAVGVIFLLVFYALVFATPLKDLGQVFGGLNDLCIAIQYLLAIPLALSLRRILHQYAPRLVTLATFVGVASMLIVITLQMALVLGVLTFAQQVLWVSFALIGGVGFWLVATGLVAQSTGRFPNSLRMSLFAALYLGYPFWAFWIGRHLRS